MESLVTFLEAVALPATIIFLVLHFQEVIQNRLTAEAGTHPPDGPDTAAAAWPTHRITVDVPRVREFLRSAATDELSDLEIAQRVAGCLIPATEMLLLATLVAAGGESSLPGGAAVSDHRARQSLVAKGYALLRSDGVYSLTEEGRRLFQDHLQRISCARESLARHDGEA